MAERKDKRVEFHARSAEHKKQFEAIFDFHASNSYLYSIIVVPALERFSMSAI